jgi:hypothetical protein
MKEKTLSALIRSTKWKKPVSPKNVLFVKKMREMESNCHANIHSMKIALSHGLKTTIPAHAAELQFEHK